MKNQGRNTPGRWGRRDVFRMGGLGLAAVALGPTLAACSRVGESADLDAMRERGFVRIGLANEIPFGFIDGAGEAAGQSPAVARAVFQELGVEDVQASPVSWDGLIPGLQTDRFDVIAAGMFITPERCGQVAFSEPTAQSPEAFLVHEGNPKNIQTFESFVENEDARVAILNGSVEQDYAEYFGVPDDQIELIPDQTTGYERLEAGRVDAVSMLSVSHTYLLLERPGPFEVTEAFFPVVDGEEQRGWGGLAFRQEDTELVAEVNRVIAEFKESGRLLEIGEEWGFTEDDLPGDVTTEELCTE